MPVCDAAPYLRRSVGSILAQTHADFELVVLENGSRDGSRSILRALAAADDRIRLFEHPRRLGFAGSSNYVASRATAPLVARMDADDECLPDRLARELDVMHRAPEVVAVGTLSDGIDSRGRRVRPRDRWRLLRSPVTPFAHGSAMFRRDAFKQIGGYREAMAWIDVDLFLRLSDVGRIAIVPEVLYSYRYHDAAGSLALTPEQSARWTALLRRSLAERRAGRDHSPVLDRADRERPDPDAVVAALHSQGALRLWAGGSPGVLRQLVRSGGLRLNARWIATFAWAAWGSLSPRSLRFALRGLIRARDWIAGMRMREGRPHEWRLT